MISRDTNDQEFAAKRQRFLAEQAYAYSIVDAESILADAVAAGAGAGTAAPTEDCGSDRE